MKPFLFLSQSRVEQWTLDTCYKKATFPRFLISPPSDLKSIFELSASAFACPKQTSGSKSQRTRLFTLLKVFIQPPHRIIFTVLAFFLPEKTPSKELKELVRGC